jgi:hypothetical protein
MKLKRITWSFTRNRSKFSSENKYIGFTHGKKAGIRSNHYLIPLSRDVAAFARSVASETNSLLLENNTCADDTSSLKSLSEEFLPALAKHPHTASIFLLSSGEELISARDIAGEIQGMQTHCEYLVVSESPDQEIAKRLGIGAASDLKMRSLSGFDHLNHLNLAIGFQSEPVDLQKLIEKLEDLKFSTSIFLFSASRADDLSKIALSGNHAILSYTPEQDYPSGSLLAPVINISSGSSFHRSIIEDFDLSHESDTDAIIKKIQDVFSLTPTFSEFTSVFEPLFPNNYAKTERSDQSNSICLIPINQVLKPLLKEVVDHYKESFICDLPIKDFSCIQARNIFIVGTGSPKEQSLQLKGADSRVTILNISDYGSLHGLASAIVEKIKT